MLIALMVEKWRIGAVLFHVIPNSERSLINIPIWSCSRHAGFELPANYLRIEMTQHLFNTRSHIRR